MSQVEIIDMPHSILGAGSPVLHTLQGQSVEPDTLPTLVARNLTEVEIQDSVPTVKLADNKKASVEEDDEVQFVFWAPRRRKKRRKRYGYRFMHYFGLCLQFE